MNLIKKNIKRVTAFAPATCANVAVGFDILGFALRGVGDSVTLTAREDGCVVLEMISPGDTIPNDPVRNCAGVPILKLLADYRVQQGFTITVEKGIPLSSGMGGSAASAVAALIALNGFLAQPLSTEELISYALLGEEAASGVQHGDNVVPCLQGGLCLVHNLNPLSIIQLPTLDLHSVIVHPHLQIETRQARAVLPTHFPVQAVIKQNANVAGMIAALYQKDYLLLQQVLQDELIESHRAALIPGFYLAQEVALAAGALGMSISGSGPSVFALAKTAAAATAIGEAMQKVFAKQKILTDMWCSPLQAAGARRTYVGEG